LLGMLTVCPGHPDQHFVAMANGSKAPHQVVSPLTLTKMQLLK